MALTRYPFSLDFPRASFVQDLKGSQKSSSHTGMPDTCRIPVLLPPAQPSRSSRSGNGNPPVGQPHGMPENPSSSLFALFLPQTLGTAPGIPKTCRARNIYIMRGKKSFTLSRKKLWQCLWNGRNRCTFATANREGRSSREFR